MNDQPQQQKRSVWVFLFFVITILVVVSGIGLLIYHTDDSLTAKPGQWSEKQKEKFEKQLSEYLTTQFDPPFDEELSRCIAKDIEQKYNYQQVIGSNGYNPLDVDVLTLVSPCAGKKGKWNSSFKKNVISGIADSNQDLKPECIECIVNHIENSKSPVEFVNLTAEQQSDLATSMSKKCDECN